MGFDERAICVCAPIPAFAASNSLNFFHSVMMLEYSLVEHGLTYVEIVFDRSFVSHPFLMPASQPASHGWWNSLEIYVGCGWPCLWIFIAMSECVNSFFVCSFSHLFPRIFSLLYLFCFVVFPLRTDCFFILFSTTPNGSWKLIRCAGGFGYF